MAMARVMLIPKDMRMFVTGYTYLGNVLNKVIAKKVFLLCFKIIFFHLHYIGGVIHRDWPLEHLYQAEKINF